MARRKVKNGEKSPWGQCLTRPVPNGRRRLVRTLTPPLLDPPLFWNPVLEDTSPEPNQVFEITTDRTFDRTYQGS